MKTSRWSWLIGAFTAGTAAALSALIASPVASARVNVAAKGEGPRACPPAGQVVSFSDSLDKLVYHGVELGGLSSLAYDPRSRAYVSAVDNHASDPARIWFIRDLSDPKVVRDPLVLRMPDGTPYNGMNSDNEGLAVLPDGNYLVSSETEPSIRIYSRTTGIQLASLPIPGRFTVTGTTPTGQATDNATLEGLTIAPSGREIIASMEGALAGDVSAAGDATLHRFLVYDLGDHGTWQLTKQLAYRTDPGNRIPEVQAYGQHSLLVEEAAFTTTAGNSVELYAVKDVDKAPDVSNVANLSLAAPSDILTKQLVANLVACPTLSAPARQTQTNPLLDNYEGMAITSGGPGRASVSMISDDNFSATQFTRVLNLTVELPS